MNRLIKQEMRIISSIILFFVCISFLLFYAYRYIEAIMIHNEEEKIKTTAVNAAKTMSDYFNGQMKDLELYFDSHYDSLESLQTHIENFLPFVIEDSIQIEVIQNSISNEDLVLGKVMYLTTELVQPNQMELVLIKPILVDQEVMFLVERIDLNSTYQLFLANIQLGEHGYSTMKDETGIIIMHGVQSQIGLDSLNDRKEIHAELDPQGIEDLVAGQLSGEVGCKTVWSYWWGKEELGQVRKLIGYSPFYLDNHMFILNVIVSYDEVTIPIRTMVLCFVLISIVIVVMLSYSIYSLVKNRRDYKTLQLQYSYENELSLNNYKLKQQQQQAMKTEKLNSLGLMASSISHEVRNLITPILVYCDLLRPSLTSEEDKTSLAEIEQLAERCNELTSQLTQYSRKENDELTMEIFDLNDTVQANLRMIQRILPATIQFEVSLSKEPLLIFGNRSAIHQIIVNCITNSIHAMKKKHGKIQVQLFHQKKQALLIISDNGCGIDPAIQAQIFEPFFTTKTDGEGTGLGLSVVKRLVTLMQGNVQLDSDAQKGTRFTFMFNLVEQNKRIQQKENNFDFLQIDFKILFYNIHGHLNALIHDAKRKKVSHQVCNRNLDLFDEIKNNSFDILIVDYIQPTQDLYNLISITLHLQANIKIILFSDSKEPFFIQDNRIKIANNLNSIEQLIDLINKYS